MKRGRVLPVSYYSLSYKKCGTVYVMRWLDKKRITLECCKEKSGMVSIITFDWMS